MGRVKRLGEKTELSTTERGSTGSTSRVITSQFSKLCFIDALYKRLEKLDAIALECPYTSLTSSPTYGILVSR
jgi:hypothetical protein